MSQNLFKLLRALMVSAVMVFAFAACSGDEPEKKVNGSENGGGDNGGGDNGGGEVVTTYSMVPVDLGLSVKWATSNLGTTVASESGEYYAWAAGKSDPVPGLCGKDWRMPTKAEFEELLNKCNVQETTQDGVKGYKITGGNGNSIFLPAAGYKKGTDLRDNQAYGYYWSSTACSGQEAAWYLDFMIERGHQGASKKLTNNGSYKIYSGSDLTYNFWQEMPNFGYMLYYPDGSFNLFWGNDPSDIVAEMGLELSGDKGHSDLGRFSADYKFTKQGTGGSNGHIVYIGIHGWIAEPYVEFYIVEDGLGSWEAPYQGQNRGTYEVDGDRYTFFTLFRGSASTIWGTKNITQYFGIRKSARQKGHVDISAHFRAWERMAQQVGKPAVVYVTAEAINSGSGNVDFTYLNIYPQASYISWLKENGLTGSDAAWDATPSKWGGEATNAYMYNKDKDEPFRFPAGFDPYLNLRDKVILQSIRPVTK